MNYAVIRLVIWKREMSIEKNSVLFYLFPTIDPSLKY